MSAVQGVQPVAVDSKTMPKRKATKLTPEKNEKPTKEVKETKETKQEPKNKSRASSAGKEKTKREKKPKTAADAPEANKTEKPKRAKKPKTAADAPTSDEQNNTQAADGQNNTQATDGQNAKQATDSAADGEAKTQRVIKLDSPLDNQGIAVGAARVRHVLVSQALNKIEYEVKEALLDAEARPTKPRPSEENPNPQPESKHAPVPISQMDAKYVAVINAARALHESGMMSKYERFHLDELKAKSAEDYKKYTKKRKFEQSECRRLGTEFNLHAFNTKFNKQFYAGFDAFRANLENQELRAEYESNKLNNMSAEARTKYDEKLKVAREDAKFDLHTFNTTFDKNFYAELPAFQSQVNEWTRASELVSKMLTRVSTETRYVLASFLDLLVAQYIVNGMQNCLKSDNKIVQLRHVLTQNENFKKTVPLDKFARTLDCYDDAVDWLGATSRAAGDLPYPKPSIEQSTSFDTYIISIFRSVKKRMMQENPDKASTYLTMSNSAEFKRFCSYMIYETIIRVGAALKSRIDMGTTKTVNYKLIRSVLSELMCLSGVEQEPVFTYIDGAIAKYENYQSTKKEESE